MASYTRAAAQRRAAYAANPALPAAYSRRWYMKNGPEARAAARKKRLKKFALTPDAWDMKHREQGLRCAACLTEDPGFKSGWRTDHCHATNQVRGILCHHCNVALGYVKDDPARLRALAAYLEAYRGGIK